MAATDHPPADPSDLQALVLPVWRRRWLVLAIVVASTVGTYVASAQQPKLFRSTTELFVANSEVEAIVTGATIAGTDRSTLDQSKLMVSEPVLGRVIQRLRLAESPSALSTTVTATPTSGSNFVAIVAERPSGGDAARVANTLAREYISYRQDQVNRDATTAVRRLRTQLASLPASNASQQRADLRDTIRQLQAAQAATPSQIRQTERAVASGVPFTPRPKRDAAFAMAISLALALALTFALERFDRRIKTVDEVSEAYGVPLLSSIPHAAKPLEIIDGKAAVPPSLREPFRSLRSNLQLASLDEPVACLAVVSAHTGEGKSTIVRNLALTYREWGLSVAVIEADLRRPTLSTAFGVAIDTPGLTGVLTGDCALGSALVDVDFDVASLDYLDRIRDTASSGAGATATARASRLVLQPSGATPSNPQAVLAADRTRQIVDELSDMFDIVLIDTPPLLAVTDAIPLLSRADGVILVSRLGVTERAAARRVTLTAQLDPNVNILGVVANDMAFQPGTGYGYGYGYGYR